MKNFVILFLICLSAYAQNFMPVSVVQSKGVSGFSFMEECERSSKEQCLDVGSFPDAVRLGYFSLEDVMGDDPDKPKYGPEEDVSPCSGKDNCVAVIMAKVCQQGARAFIDAQYTKVYCTKLLGYDQKVVGKKIIIDQAAVSAHKFKLQGEAQVKAIISAGKGAREACERVLDLIGGFNLLSPGGSANADQMVSLFATAKQHLNDGRPGKAKKAIQAIPVDGVLVTEQMKALALEQLKDYEAVE